MRLQRKAQGFRASSPLVILLIGLILILYILFLPPAQRESLLSGSGGDGYAGGYAGGYADGYAGGYGSVPVSGGTVLMDKFVGTLQGPSSATVEHSIPSTTVFTATNTNEVKFLDSMVVRQGAFSKQEAKFTFLADTGSSKNYLLTFNVEQAGGTLQILLNGQLIFERAITSKSPEPIKLPQELLHAQNTLTFRVGGTGWQFWNTNVYQLRNVLVSADVTSYEGSSSEQHFTITPDEYERLEKGALDFLPDCDPKGTGRLSITVNGQLLYAGYLDCGVLTHQDIAKEQLNAGDNSIGFTSHEGSYLVDRIKITSILNNEEPLTLYFNLPPDMFQQANVFAGRVVVTIRFSDMSSEKRGSIVINGFQDTFVTNADYYQATIDPNILTPGPNSIQIIPDGGTLSVPQLRVELLG